ncbi:hypothetical protein MRB53_027946 [Persea americana]|uniref:Uncharacterized protein n=1 Tax=Persea americana TaxID=3435 RepID=A0ACC2KEH2_PERAE|nr:hypothetical protein MRB53_027946 [Persea americana]
MKLVEATYKENERGCEIEDELLQAAHAQLWTQVFSFAHFQTLRCTIELPIPDIIHAHAGPTSLSHLASHLPLPSSPNCLLRLMCFLSHLNIYKHSMITPSGGDESEEDAFELTPLSRLLVRGEEKNMVPMVTVGFNVLMVPWHHIIGSLEKSSDNAFKRVFGVEFYEYAQQNV